MGRWRRDCADDLDPVVVDRLVAGIPVDAMPWERCAAAGVLRRRGLFYSQIAERLHVNERQVARDLSRLRMVDETLRPRRLREAARRRQVSLPLLENGWRNRDVARLLGVPQWLIAQDKALLSATTDVRVAS